MAVELHDSVACPGTEVLHVNVMVAEEEFPARSVAVNLIVYGPAALAEIVVDRAFGEPKVTVPGPDAVVHE